mmetsp:Transcript_36694/g.82594  ORF Transcript_36694/g.82594 Transcript_36694/m.82594 type:complete len:347 (+) Transcript_36694:42-1082(+)
MPPVVKRNAVCRVCLHEAAEYTCPRCESPYCSLSCYKDHSSQCTEQFYEEQVHEDLVSQRAGPEERRQLEQALVSLRQLDEGSGDEAEVDAEEVDPEEELRRRVEAGEDVTVEDLPPELRRRFLGELKRGVVGQQLAPWEPWWTRVAIEESEEVEHLCCVGNRTAHPAVAFSVVEVLYAYAHTCRSFNGDLDSDPAGATQHLLLLAKGLAGKHTYESASELVHVLLTTRGRVEQQHSTNLRCWEDVVALLRERAFVARGLRETEQLVQRTQKRCRGKVATKLMAAGKKLVFLRSYAEHHRDLVEFLLLPLGEALDPLLDKQRPLERVAAESTVHTEQLLQRVGLVS